MQLRNYQITWEQGIYSAWQSAQNVLGVLPTGGGKTPVIADILNKHRGYSCAIAHRKELISQISLKLAMCELRHRIIAPNNIIKWIIQLHVEEIGQSYYDSTAACTVASVDTIKARKDKLQNWLSNTTLWVIDEAHHVLRKNKWGTAVSLFPNAKGLGVTATPYRTDGQGLGRHAEGVFDSMVEGPGMRELINMGYLSDYRIFAPSSDLNLEDIPVSPSGEFARKQLKQRIQKSHLVGDIVTHYFKFAPDTLCMTFPTDIEDASEITAKFKNAGVKTEIVTSKTPDKIRMEIMRRFKRREILQIVNVDLYGEGIDVPALEAIIMGRPTQSLVLFRQQFGRVVRILEGKENGIVIDPVSNIKRHGLPDARRAWSLNRQDKRASKKPAGVPTRTCLECTSIYEAIYVVCPYCGCEYIPAGRSKPEHVDGDLTELDTQTLAVMRGEIDRVNLPADVIREKLENTYMSAAAVAGATKQHRIRQYYQKTLRESIAWWAGHAGHNRALPELYRLFYFTFGIDVMTAQTFGRKKAELLTIAINQDIDQLIKMK